MAQESCVDPEVKVVEVVIGGSEHVCEFFTNQHTPYINKGMITRAAIEFCALMHAGRSKGREHGLWRATHVVHPDFMQCLRRATVNGASMSSSALDWRRGVSISIHPPISDHNEKREVKLISFHFFLYMYIAGQQIDKMNVRCGMRKQDLPALCWMTSDMMGGET